MRTVFDLNSTGDAIDFMTDNIEYLERIEKAFEAAYGKQDALWEALAQYIEQQAARDLEWE